MSESYSVRPINKEILGMDGANNLITQTIPAIGIIDTSSFRAGDPKNEFSFSVAPPITGRLGVFAAKKNNVERAVIMLLPQTGQADGVLICITHGFAQASSVLEPLGWSNPLSQEHVKFALLKHVVNRWGAQMLASRRNLAMMYILRAKGNELGPFARDGAFVKQVLTDIAALTGNAFSFDQVEGFTFSSGIADFNHFIGAASSHLNFRAVYSIDPANSLVVGFPKGGIRKQYSSGTAGGILPGFEPMPLERWRKESRYETDKGSRFQYLHNHCMPLYCLYLALQT